MFIDTHCHIYKKSCKNIEKTIKESLKNNVKKLINCSENIESTLEILDLSKTYPEIIYPTIGIHPEYAVSTNLNVINEMENLIKANNFVAVGEIGLDYYYSDEHKVKQQDLFRKQLFLAEKYKLPVLIHSRDATRDMINILKEYEVKGIIHSFCENKEIAKEYIEMGFLLGINGVLTFKNSELKKEINEISINHIVLETDSPFLSPHPYRGKVNTPANIPVIAEFLAETLNISLEQVMKTTTLNALQLFDKINTK